MSEREKKSNNKNLYDLVYFLLPEMTPVSEKFALLLVRKKAFLCLGSVASLNSIVLANEPTRSHFLSRSIYVKLIHLLINRNFFCSPLCVNWGDIFHEKSLEINLLFYSVNN